MTSSDGSIGGAEVAVLTTAGSFAAGVFIVPRLLVADAGRAGILALLLVSLAAIGWTALIARRSRRLDERNLPLALAMRGGVLGRAWLLLLALFELMLAGAVLQQYATMAAAVILPGGSRATIGIIIGLAAFTAARHRLQGLARTVYVSFVFAALLALGAFILLLARSEQLAAVLPGPNLRAAPILLGALDSVVLYAGVTTIVTFLPAHMPAHRMPAVMVGALVLSLLVIIAYVSAVATGGPGYVLTQIWPVVSALRTLVLRSFVLNRIGLIVVLSWSAFVLTFAAVHLWAATEYTCVAIGSQKRRPMLALIATLVVLVYTAFGGAEAAIETTLRNVITPAVVVVFLSWLLLAYLLTRRRPEVAGG